MSNSQDMKYDNHKDFLAEAEDLMRDLNKNIYLLKSICNSNGGHTPDVVNELFREIHTLKGISEATGFTRISSLSHKLEDLLDCLRFGRIQLNVNVIETLFEVADIFTELLKNINEQGTEYAEIGPISDSIGKLLNHTARGDSVKINYLSSIPSDLAGTLSEFEQYRLMEACKEGCRVYRIIVRMHIDNVDEEMAELRSHLTGSGEIVAVIPVSGFSKNDTVSFEIIYASEHEYLLPGPEPCAELNSESLQWGGRLGTGLSGAIISIQDIELSNSSYDTQNEPQNIDAAELHSHSARSIAKTVRVDIEKLEMLLNSVGEILLLNSSISLSINELKMKYGQDLHVLDLNKTGRSLHKKIASLRDGLIDIQLVPIEFLFSRLHRIVDLVSEELSKEIRLEVSGGDTKLDKSIIEELADPLMHIIRNAIDHGIEDEEVRMKSGKEPAGTIRIKAVQKDSSVVIDIEDDGGGIDYNVIYNRALEMGLIGDEDKDEERLLRMLFMPGFTTKSTVNDFSGRGVGLDVVAKNIESLSGMIEVETVIGRGTTFRITLPITLLIVRALIVSESGREFAIPVNSISENIRLQGCDIKMIMDRESINLRGDYLPIVRLKDILKYPGGHGESVIMNNYVIIAGLAQKKIGIIVDKIYGQREILIKSPGKFLREIKCIAGFAEIDAKKVIPVVDISGIVERAFAPQTPS